MTDTVSPSEVDLTNCDKEPIHILGRVQSHGIVMVLHEPALTIVQCSSNLPTLLNKDAADVLNQPVEMVLGSEHQLALAKTLEHEDVNDNPLYLWTIQPVGISSLYDGMIHRHNDVLILELEPAVELMPHRDVSRLVRNAINTLQRSPTFAAFSHAAVNEVRMLTGFDRVMFYQFDEDGHGHVIAEAVNEGLDSFLGLHYPASDIPKQARALYVLNWLRLIADVNDTPSALVPPLNPITNQPLDLSFAVLRSVSPIHIEYLQNMGIGASMSMSLVREGELWGLIACHHYAPKYIPYETRAACEFLAQAVSLQLDNKMNIEHHAYMQQLHAAIPLYVANMSNALRWEIGLLDNQPTLLDFVHADGVTLCFQYDCGTFGVTPPQPAIDELIKWLQRQRISSVFATDHLVGLYPEWEPYCDIASGILAMPITPEFGEFIVWFRKELVQTVNWAGEPTKPVEVTEHGLRLSPRKSFELWKQTVRQHSQRWQAFEIAAVEQFRTAMLEIVIRKADELARMNTDLSRSNADLDAFAYVTSHDLKEPLRGIHNYAHFLLEDYADKLQDEGREYILTMMRLTQRMNTLIESLLQFSQIGRLNFSMQTVDLNLVLKEVVEDLSIMINHEQVDIRLHPLPTLVCDSVRVGQIFYNLIVNGLKYNTSANKWIEVGSYSRDQLEPAWLPPANINIVEPIVYVRDNGIGIPEHQYDIIFKIFKRLHGRDQYGGGTGAGLTIVKKIVERHNAAIWVHSIVGTGTTFFFTLQG